MINQVLSKLFKFLYNENKSSSIGASNLNVNNAKIDISSEYLESKTTNNNISTEPELETNLIKTDDISDLIEHYNTSNLVPLTCGHNGIFSNTEIDYLNHYLRVSKFID